MNTKLTNIAQLVASAIWADGEYDEAEKLLNNGDMLLLTPDFTGLRRVQGVYVSDKEISDVVEFCKKQVGPQYDPAFLDLRSEEEKAEKEKLKVALGGNTNNATSNGSYDPLYEEIKNLVLIERKASTSFIQRKFAIGYNKAVDLAKAFGIHKNFPTNYIEDLPAKDYADTYVKLKISSKYSDNVFVYLKLLGSSQYCFTIKPPI